MRTASVFVVVGDDGQDGSEDLLLRDAHVAVQIGEQCGLRVEAALQSFKNIGAARHEAGPFLGAAHCGSGHRARPHRPRPD